MDQSSEHGWPDKTEFTARIIGAVGQLMSDFHARDLAVQNAISEIACAPETAGLNMTDLQHIDLVTQTHADLAKFLTRLAQSIRENEVAAQTLAGTLTLRSLQDTLLAAPESKSGPVASSNPDPDPGEMLLF